MNKADLFYCYVHCAGLADVAHKGQKRVFTKEPYINHPRRVAANVALVCDDPDAIAAALLHDVMEDTVFTAEDLIARGVSFTTAKYLKFLTHSEGQSYKDYIQQVIEGGIIPMMIKQADIADNLANLPLDKTHLLSKYLKALETLAQSYRQKLNEFQS